MNFVSLLQPIINQSVNEFNSDNTVTEVRAKTEAVKIRAAMTQFTHIYNIKSMKKAQ